MSLPRRDVVADALDNAEEKQMINSTDTYLAYIKQCLEKYPEIDDAMRFIVSSDGRSIKGRGEEELRFLLNQGLGENDYLVDVGCGAGALLMAGIEQHCGIYIGIDASKDVAHYAAQLCDKVRNIVESFSMADACNPNEADWVVFFSVFSHMLDHEIYRMLQDAHQLLKPGGRVAFTYRDWSDPDQWVVFMNMVKPDGTPGKIPIYDNLISGFAIRTWLKEIGYSAPVVYLPFCPFPKAVLGQTTIVARK